MRNITVKSNQNRPRLERSKTNGALVVMLTGHWNVHSIHLIDDEVRQLENDTNSQSSLTQLTLDVSAISNLDTSGAWLIERLAAAFIRHGVAVNLVGMQAGWQSLLQSVGEFALSQDQAAKPIRRREVGHVALGFLDWLGRKMAGMARDFLMAMHILGATISGLAPMKRRRAGINIAAIITQIDRMGVGAVPIILLMSFIVGAIIAQQGAFQLRYFGAEIFVVDLVGILVFRELGVLMTAIMIAGRSGSAITAEIGSMKMREEVDALTVMGLNPVAVLVLPRLIALAVILPLLTILANVAALVGAGLVALIYSDIPREAFIGRLYEAVWMQTYLAGLIKAPFMALIIGIIAAVEGMKVKGSAESLGRRVTSSVVKSIFIVIVIDGLFAVFYASINF